MSKQTRFKPKFHIKKGDRVKVIAGASKGTIGEVLEILSKENRAIVDGANKVKKHQKPTNESQGGITEIPAPIHISNLMIVTANDVATRIGRRKEGDKLVRYSKKTGEIIK